MLGMNQGTDYGIILVTAPSEAEAAAIAEALIQGKLAACVSIWPVGSLYTWQGQVQQEREYQLLIKTHLAHYPALEAKIRELHSYEVPEIIAVPIVQGSAAYLQWIGETTGQR